MSFFFVCVPPTWPEDDIHSNCDYQFSPLSTEIYLFLNVNFIDDNLSVIHKLLNWILTMYFHTLTSAELFK